MNHFLLSCTLAMIYLIIHGCITCTCVKVPKHNCQWLTTKNTYSFISKIRFLVFLVSRKKYTEKVKTSKLLLFQSRSQSRLATLYVVYTVFYITYLTSQRSFLVTYAYYPTFLYSINILRLLCVK